MKLVKLNPKAKEKMQEQKEQVVNAIKTAFPDVPFFEDEIAEDEEKDFVKTKYHAFVMQMGNFTQGTNISYLSQDIVMDYYSENRDDVDETILDVIAAITQVRATNFVATTKLRARVKDTQRFIDVVSIEFRRTVKYGC